MTTVILAGPGFDLLKRTLYIKMELELYLLEAASCFHI